MLEQKEMSKRNAKIIKLRDKGKTIKSIADEVGLSTTRVSRILHPEPITKPKKRGKAAK